MDPYLESTPFIQVNQSNELGRAFNGLLADHHQFQFAHMLGWIDSIDADIARHRRAAPFKWTTILDTRVPIAEDLRAAQAPLVLAQVECYTGRSAASRHPSRWRGAATDM
jgi:hypothetical protein